MLYFNVLEVVHLGRAFNDTLKIFTTKQKDIYMPRGCEKKSRQGFNQTGIRQVFVDAFV